MNKEAFVYRWREKITGRWYIGYHKGRDDDGYTCSSRIVAPLIKQNPQDWQRKILCTGTKTQMIALEHRLLKRLNARTNAKSYNKSNGALDFAPLTRWDQLGYNFTQLTAEEIAQQYKKELENGDHQRIFLCDEWLMSKLLR